MSNTYYFPFWKGSIFLKIYNLLYFVVRLPMACLCLMLYSISSKNVKNMVLSDVGTINNLLFHLTFFRYYRNLFYHRIGRKSILLSWLFKGDSSVIVPFSTKIGKHAFFVHNRGSHLNASSIGNDFMCYQHVTIGAAHFEDKNRPVIGNNVCCATGAVIVGNITVGNNVKIGPNAFVNKSVPNDCVVIGNPAFIVKKNGVSAKIPL